MKTILCFCIPLLLLSCNTVYRHHPPGTIGIGKQNFEEKHQLELPKLKLNFVQYTAADSTAKNNPFAELFQKKYKKNLAPGEYLLHLKIAGEYRLIETLNQDKNLLKYLDGQKKIQIITEIVYASGSHYFDPGKELFIQSDRENPLQLKIYNTQETILLERSRILDYTAKYICISRKHGKLKVMDLVKTREDCPEKETYDYEKYKF